MSRYSWITSRETAESVGLQLLGKWTTTATAYEDAGIEPVYLPTGEHGEYELWVEERAAKNYQILMTI